MLNQRLEISVRNAQLDDAPRWRAFFAIPGDSPTPALSQRCILSTRFCAVTPAGGGERSEPNPISWSSRSAKPSPAMRRAGEPGAVGATPVKSTNFIWRPSIRGSGLGEHLFEACRATLDELALPHLIVWALAENETARAFYRRCGGRPARRSCVRLGKSIGIRVAFEW